MTCKKQRRHILRTSLFQIRGWDYLLVLLGTQHLFAKPTQRLARTFRIFWWETTPLQQREITQQTFVLMKTSWRRLEDVFRLRLQKTSSRRLQDVLIKTNMFALALRLQKTSSRRLGQDQYIRLVHTSSRRLQDVFKTSSRHLQDVFKTSRKYVLKTSSRRFEDVSSS